MRLSFPYKLIYAVTYRCNLRCKTCSIWQCKSEELSLNQIKSFFNKSNEFSWIDLIGGEIFLREDLIEIIAVINQYCKRLLLLHFPTNGWLTETIISSVKKIMLNKKFKLIVTVSIDGPEGLHDELRGKTGSWEKAIQTYIRLKEFKNIEVYIGMTLSAYNLDKIYQTYTSVKSIYSNFSWKDLHVNIFHSSPHYYGDVKNSNFNKEILRKSINKYINLRGKQYNLFNFLEKRYLDNIKNYLNCGKMPTKCQALSCSCFLSPDGMLYPCSIFDKPLGNIKDCDFKEIWNSPSTIDIRNNILKDLCPGCWTPCEAYQAILGSIVKLPFNF